MVTKFYFGHYCATRQNLVIIFQATRFGLSHPWATNLVNAIRFFFFCMLANLILATQGWLDLIYTIGFYFYFNE